MEKNSRNVVINISTSTIAKSVIVLFLFVLLFQVRDVVLVALAAVVLASAIEPATLWFQRHHFRRLFAVIITYVLLGSAFFGLIFYIVPIMFSELSNYLANLPKYLNIAQAWLPLDNPNFLEGSATIQHISTRAFL